MAQFLRPQVQKKKIVNLLMTSAKHSNMPYDENDQNLNVSAQGIKLGSII